jgi:hypothetical protein
VRRAYLFAASLSAAWFGAACDDSTSPIPSGPAVPVASIPIDLWGGGCLGQLSEVRIVLGYGFGSSSDDPPTVMIVDSLLITSPDSQVVLTRDSSEFAAVENLLTNGIDDNLRVDYRFSDSEHQLVCAGGSFGPESQLYEDRIEASILPDLAGLTIARVTVQVEVLSLDGSGGGLTDITMKGRILFEGWP